MKNIVVIFGADSLEHEASENGLRVPAKQRRVHGHSY
jgi:hypothetical protein